MKDYLISQFIDMLVDFLIENMDEWKAKLIAYSDEYAKRTETKWDDRAAELLRALLGAN